MEAQGLSQRADFEGISEEEEDSNKNNSKEAKEEKKKPLQLIDPERSLKGVQDQRVTKACRCCQSRNLEEDYLLFLYEFPAQKAEIEKCILSLRKTAEAISKTRKDCRIANITASSAGLTSGILTILGLTLTPVTAGASLILTATGLGLGAAAATTGVSAQISEHIINSKHSKRSQTLITSCEKRLNKCMGSLAIMLGRNKIELDSRLCSGGKQRIEENLQVVLSGGNAAQLIPKMVNTVKGIKANVQALKVVQANPALLVAGRVSRSAFKGTVLAVSNGARVFSAVTTGLFILYDTFILIKEAINLAKGSEVEKATKIRDEANKLEKILQNLSELHDQLRESQDAILCTFSWP